MAVFYHTHIAVMFITRPA